MRTTLVHGTLYLDADPRSGRLWDVVDDGAIVMDDGRITVVGPTRHVTDQEMALGTVIDAEGRAVIPGLIDCHTHLPFAGWRVDEYVARLSGQSYETVARQKGGIVRSSRQWAEAADSDILAFVQSECQEAIRWGTTVIEMKCGYGLNVEQELRALRLIRKVSDTLPVRVTATGLFFHALPLDQSAEDWVNTVRTRLLPLALREGLIDAVDAFIERTAFSADQVEPVFRPLPASLPIRLHTNQFSRQGGVELAVRLKARAVDHLESLEPDELALLAQHRIAAVLMPGAAFYTSHQYAPARRLIDHGVRVALATDFNPGTSPINNLPTVMGLAVNLMDMSPDEALAAVTRHAAYVLGISSDAGSLHPGYSADLVVLDTDRISMIPYRLGHNPVHQIILHGQRWPA